jgi:hypothetical protein
MAKILVFMETGIGYVSSSGVAFSREHPYQLVEEEEAQVLLNTSRFRTASADELKSYYNYQVAT